MSRLAPSSPRCERRIAGGRTELEGHDLGWPPSENGAVGEAKIDAFVRPHDVELERRSATESKGIPAAVLRTTRLGWQVKIELELPSARTLTVHYGKEQADAIGVRAGDQVLVTLRGAKVFARHAPTPSPSDAPAPS
jgi:ABC-type sulfate/molybdate transport systems ATPase subunit